MGHFWSVLSWNYIPPIDFSITDPLLHNMPALVDRDCPHLDPRPLSEDPPKEYTVVVRGERFILSDEQLNFDAPNYFTELFGTEGTARETFLYRDPKLFQIIESYLSGYDIFPLPDTAIPYMSRETISKNLLADARFYGLDRLVDELNPPQPSSPPPVSVVLVNSVHALWFNDEDPNARWRIKTVRLCTRTEIPLHGSSFVIASYRQY